jgi:hypothetical protein
LLRFLNLLRFERNTLINKRREGGTFLRLWSEKFPDGLDARILDNLTVGGGDLAPPPHGRFEGNQTLP